MKANNEKRLIVKTPGYHSNAAEINNQMEIAKKFIAGLVQQGKSKKSKVKRKNFYAANFLPISNGILISAALY